MSLSHLIECFRFRPLASAVGALHVRNSLRQNEIELLEYYFLRWTIKR
jgi:hypothetical protein